MRSDVDLNAQGLVRDGVCLKMVLDLYASWSIGSTIPGKMIGLRPGQWVKRLMRPKALACQFNIIQQSTMEPQRERGTGTDRRKPWHREPGHQAETVTARDSPKPPCAASMNSIRAS